jgi:hypothetical protein
MLFSRRGHKSLLFRRHVIWDNPLEKWSAGGCPDGRGVGMRRAVAALMTLLLASALLALAGCGGGAGTESQARAYVKAGDAEMAKVESQFAELGNITSTFATDYASGKITDPATVKQTTDQIKGMVKDVDGAAVTAKSQYEKIRALEGVPDYVKYADLQIEVINKLTAANDLIVELMDLVSTANSNGKPVDTAKVTAVATKLQSLGTEISNVGKQALELKTQKKL